MIKFDKYHKSVITDENVDKIMKMMERRLLPTEYVAFSNLLYRLRHNLHNESFISNYRHIAKYKDAEIFEKFIGICDVYGVKDEFLANINKVLKDNPVSI